MRTVYSATLAILLTSTSAIAQTPWPGQPGNPVGWQSYGCPGGQLTPYTDGDITVGGTAANPRVFKCMDFVGGIAIFAPHLRFEGSRFQSNATNDTNVYLDNQSGVTDVTFYRSSTTPLVTLAPQPPNGGGYATWPSGGAGTQLWPEDINSTPNPRLTSIAIPQSAGYQYGINDFSNGTTTIDHCDFWGAANYIVFYSTTGQKTVIDSWLHDNRHPGFQPNDDHGDGPGYLDGGVETSNVLIQHNTIAMPINTNAIAFQGGTSGGNNIRILNNFLSGADYNLTVNNTPGANNDMVSGNVFSTVFPWVFGPVLPGLNAFNANGDSWSGNKLSVWPGTAPTQYQNIQWQQAWDGYFVLSDGSYSPTE